MARLTAWHPAVVVLACALAGADPAAGLDPAKAVTQYLDQAWRSDEGLPQNSVLAMAQTPDGYLWIGTEEGLARFDGVRFRVFDPSNTPELHHRVVRALAVDRQGALWIGTLGGGVVRLAAGRFTAFGSAQGLSDERVRVISVDRNGRLWAGSNQGLSVFEDGRFVAARAKPSTGAGAGPAATDALAVPVRAIHQTRDGALWIGTRARGLLCWKDGAVATYTTRDGLPSDVVLALHEDAEGRLWVGTTRGVARFQDGRVKPGPQFTAGSTVEANAIASDAAGNIWIGTNGGLYRYRGGSIDSYPPGQRFAREAVVSLLEDREGSLWVGTLADGLHQLLDGRFTVYSTLEGISDDHVWCVYEDRDGSIWLGTESGGLSRLRRGAVHVYKRRNGLPSDTVYTAVRDLRGDVWAGTPKGLARIRGDTISTLTKRDGLADDYINSVLQDRAGNVWVATAEGVSRIHKGGIETLTVADGLSSNHASRLLEGRDGSVWIGTVDAGLNGLLNGRVSRYGTPEGLASHNVTALYEDERGVLWIGGTGGLARLQNGRASVCSSRQGLPTDTIFEIVDDRRGYFWLSSNKGLFRVRRSDLEACAGAGVGPVPFTAYGKADGMRSVECNGGTQPAGLRAGDGRLWFPTIRGVVVVDVDRLEASALPPSVVVEELRVNNSPVPLAGEPTLPPGGGLVELQYTGLDFGAVDKLRFRYQLDGFDDSWQEAGPRRTAYYTNLPPGRYRFRVAAQSREGAWGESAADARFRIRPRFHQTAWFYLLVASLGGLLAFTFHRVQVTLLQARVAVFEERTRIAQDVHDGVAQGLGGIAMQLEAARNAERSGVHLERARTLTDQTLAELRRSLAALRPALLDRASLPEALEHLVDPLRDGTGTEIEFCVEGVEVDLPASLEVQLLRITQEAVFNATRHGRATHVVVRLVYDDPWVRLEVRDDGLGFDASRADRERGFGLQSMRRRAERVGGRLAMTSEPGHGTEVSVAIPARRRLLVSLWKCLQSLGRLAPWGARHERSSRRSDPHPLGGRPPGHP